MQSLTICHILNVKGECCNVQHTSGHLDALSRDKPYVRQIRLIVIDRDNWIYLQYKMSVYRLIWRPCLFLIKTNALLFFSFITGNLDVFSDARRGEQTYTPPEYDKSKPQEKLKQLPVEALMKLYVALFLKLLQWTANPLSRDHFQYPTVCFTLKKWHNPSCSS